MNINPQKLIWKLPSLLAAFLLVLGFTLSAATCHLKADTQNLFASLDQQIAQSICSTDKDADHSENSDSGHDCEQCLHMQTMLSSSEFVELQAGHIERKETLFTTLPQPSQISNTNRFGRAPPKTV